MARGYTRLTPNEWIVWRPGPVVLRPLPAEWIWRDLRDADLTDPAMVLTILDRQGMIWGRYEDLRDDDEVPAELPYPARPPKDDLHAYSHLTDVVAYLSTLRRIADEWALCVEYERPLPAGFRYALRVGLRPFTAWLTVAAALDAATSGPVVDLYEAGCWQLAQAILDRPRVRRCQNVTCGRVFFQHVPVSERPWSTDRVKYCSDSCRAAQNQRDYRHRRIVTLGHTERDML